MPMDEEDVSQTYQLEVDPSLHSMGHARLAIFGHLLSRVHLVFRAYLVDPTPLRGPVAFRILLIPTNARAMKGGMPMDEEDVSQTYQLEVDQSLHPTDHSELVIFGHHPSRVRPVSHAYPVDQTLLPRPIAFRILLIPTNARAMKGGMPMDEEDVCLYPLPQGHRSRDLAQTLWLLDLCRVCWPPRYWRCVTGRLLQSKIYML
jgi:hypothetical protein